MDAKEIIELYNKGMMDEDGKLIEEVITEFGRDDGEAYAHLAWDKVPCGDVIKLVERALFIEELLSTIEPEEMLCVIYCMAKSYDEELAEEIYDMGMNEKVLAIYNIAFVTAFMKMVRERCMICEACRL